MKKPTALIILDGFGYRKESEYNAITQAKTPFLDYLFTHYPHTLLHASGKYVGLPEGFAGNSEVGHMTIGAGKIIEQPLTTINESIQDGSFFSNKNLIEPLKKLAQSNHTLHIMGLLSDAGVHSHIDHLFALLDAAHTAGCKDIVVHAFLDGRDTPPQSAQYFLEHLENKLTQIPGAQLGSITGRFYAMDRNKNWDRTQTVYNMLVSAGPRFSESADHNKEWYRTQKVHDTLIPTGSSEYINPFACITNFYNQGIYDEFIPPIKLTDNEIKSGDGIIFFNFRSDRARQLYSSLTDQNFSHFKTKPLELSFFITMVQYNHEKNAATLFKNPLVSNTLKEILCDHDVPFLAIAETEKYAHVTYFFGGGTEKPCATETQILIPSLTVKTYRHNPEMSAHKITKTVCNAIKNDAYQFYLINYANADMVGHSGDMQATMKAIEYLDSQLQILYKEFIEKHDGTLYITSDHGNAELMYNTKHQQPHTAHTLSPVPFIMVNKESFDKKVPLALKELADIAPFIVKRMGI